MTLQPTRETPAVPGGVLTNRSRAAFEVHLEVFEGPFDLLLGLISKHRLDLTEISLAQVTDEFLVHLRLMQQSDASWDLSEASEFVLVAATLLDLKAARLLPHSEEDDEDLALIEARDLLFARLLQYRAFRDVAEHLRGRFASVGRMYPRSAGLEEQFARLLPDLVMSVTPEQLAMVAASALQPRTPPEVSLAHLHAATVSVREQAHLMTHRLRREVSATFRSLVADADSTLVVVARFLALLELYREGQVAFEQAQALGDLSVRWTGPTNGELVDVVVEEYEGEPSETSETSLAAATDEGDRDD